jgi:pilus assembly protein CpaF
MMCAMTGFDLPIGVVRQYIAAGIRLVVHVARLKGGLRRVTRVTEVTGVAGDNYRLQDIFGFRQTGLDDSGRARGEFYATGDRPECLEQIEAYGLSLPTEMFAQRTMGV